MLDGWLTIEEAAERVERSTDTIYRWGRLGRMRIIAGYVPEAQLLEADRLARQRRGRPRKGTAS